MKIPEDMYKKNENGIYVIGNPGIKKHVRPPKKNPKKKEEQAGKAFTFDDLVKEFEDNVQKKPEVIKRNGRECVVIMSYNAYLDFIELAKVSEQLNSELHDLLSASLEKEEG